MDNEESVTEITAPGTKPAESAAPQGGNNTAGSDRGQGKAPAAGIEKPAAAAPRPYMTVSYTHLTLPTTPYV